MLGDKVHLSQFQFILNVLDEVEVRALCKPVRFFHTGNTSEKENDIY